MQLLCVFPGNGSDAILTWGWGTLEADAGKRQRLKTQPRQLNWITLRELKFGYNNMGTL